MSGYANLAHPTALKSFAVLPVGASASGMVPCPQMRGYTRVLHQISGAVIVQSAQLARLAGDVDGWEEREIERNRGAGTRAASWVSSLGAVPYGN